MAKARKLRTRLEVESLEIRECPSTSPLFPAGMLRQETFQSTAPAALPTSWNQWSNPAPVAVTSEVALSGSRSLAVDGVTGQTSRAWANQQLAADVKASAAVFSDSLVPGQIIVRGANLDTPKPTFYSASLTRGLNLQLAKVINGVSTTFGQVKSTDYVSNKWVNVALQARGTTVQAQVMRTDTNQYLTSSGAWQATPTWAITRTDASIATGGYVALGRPGSYTGNVNFDNLKVVGVSSTSSSNPILLQQNFDTTALGSLPTNWSQWTDQGVFGVTAVQAYQSSQSLAGDASSGQAARAWLNLLEPADIQAGSALFVNSLIPGQVFVRGSNLDSATPSFYAVSVTRGLQVQLLKVVNGSTTVLGTLSSRDYVSNQWVVATVSAKGGTISAQIYRLDTNQYLAANGTWQSTPTWALVKSDFSITGQGRVGVARPASYAGTVLFDDFTVALPGTATIPVTSPSSLPPVTSGTPGVTDTTPPKVAITSPVAGSILYGATIVHANVTDDTGVVRVDFLLDNQLQATDMAGPFDWVLDPTTLADGAHQITVQAYDRAGNRGQTSESITTHHTLPSTGGLTLPRHYRHIRIAELAYGGTTLGSFEFNLLRNSVDLIIPNTSYLSDIRAVAPNTPQLIYTNVSSLYFDLLTDWLHYADQHGVSRESAFYHVNRPTPFSGTSSSSQPVNWFWGVFTGGQSVGFTDFTQVAHLYNNTISLGQTGTSLYIGYPDKFREINVMLDRGASAGWRGVLEYATSVDSQGNPIGWSTLSTLSDSTFGLTRSGTILFDPPSNWKASNVNGSDSLFYVRLRTISDGTPPVIRMLLGRDYVGANGGTSGVVPAFDANADVNHDGYLNDSEYAHRRPGFNARFVYESRAFTGYGQERPPTNPASLAFRNWAVDYSKRFLAANPQAGGLFMDNSAGRLPLDTTGIIESASTYSTDYGTLIHAINQAIAPRWIIANTAGGQTDADGVVRLGTSYYEEFAIRALAHNYVQFEELAAQVAHRMALQGSTGFAVLDSLPRNGSPTDARTQIATLAYYYLIGDPNRTFLNFFGGSEPSTSWTRHWSPAAAFDIGLPRTTWSLFAQGTDPSNTSLTYRVYQRSYTNALVLYKPLAYTQGFAGQANLDAASATVHYLNGTYRPLNADGTLGAPVTRITLRNGEGAILIRV